MLTLNIKLFVTHRHAVELAKECEDSDLRFFLMDSITNQVDNPRQIQFSHNTLAVENLVFHFGFNGHYCSTGLGCPHAHATQLVQESRNPCEMHVLFKIYQASKNGMHCDLGLGIP
jgi:hypothetical protein